MRIFSSDRLPVMRQSELAECGLACLAMVVNFHGLHLSLLELRQRYPGSLKGSSLLQVAKTADDLGFNSRALRCEVAELDQVKLPAILHWNLDHFVVLKAVSKSGFEIVDPGHGARKVGHQEMNSSFTGVLLELSPAKSFENQEKSPRLKLRDVVRLEAATKTALAQALVLSITLQVFVLASPLLMQLVIDGAVAQSSIHLLVVIVLGFAALKIFETINTLVRGLMLQFLSSSLSYDTESSVFHHLMKLPLSYFQSRNVGDIQQRFSALLSIQQVLVASAVTALIDGVLAITLGATLLIYNFWLGLIVLASATIYLLVRLIYLSLAKKHSMRTMLSEAEKQSHFLETLRAMKLIKVSGLVVQREQRWRNLAASLLTDKIRLGNLNLYFQAFRHVVLGLGNLLIIYVAASMVISDYWSIGMVIAFLAYKQQLEARLIALFETWINIRMLDVNLERVADITMTPIVGSSQSVAPDHEVSGRIEIRGVSFSYSDNEPPILRNVNLIIEPNERVAFIGPSGSGKTTLLNVIAGILEPQQGDIIVDGLPVARILGAGGQISTVLQDDQLLSGTIEQNIALFSGKIDSNLVEKASKKAAIFADIQRMPMGFRSLVGDMGAALSGGQKQRIFLARALYRNPRILIMDEPTSQLDIFTERNVVEALNHSDITQLISSHRRETILSADRVFEVRNGAVTEIQISDFSMELYHGGDSLS